MKEDDIPDLNVFMMCEQLNEDALTHLSQEYTIRTCRPDELNIWKAFPFENEEMAKEYEEFMSKYFIDTYIKNQMLFFNNTLFICDKEDRPVATCSTWKAYGKFNTIQWFKTLKSHEAKGIGRALLSIIMKGFAKKDYPIFLHTQPGSFRAIKLYTDFGFNLLSGQKFGTRTNDLNESLLILKKFMPKQEYDRLKAVKAPTSFLKALKYEQTIQF